MNELRASPEPNLFACQITRPASQSASPAVSVSLHTFIFVSIWLIATAGHSSKELNRLQLTGMVVSGRFAMDKAGDLYPYIRFQSKISRTLPSRPDGTEIPAACSIVGIKSRMLASKIFLPADIPGPVSIINA